MMLRSLVLVATATIGVIGSPLSDSAEPWGLFTNNTIFQPTGNDFVSYPRYVELQDGTIIATVRFSGPSPDYLPIFKSKDGGASWKHVSNITDTVNHWKGVIGHPALVELTEPMGGYDAGTILGAGNNLGPNATRIDLYASRDGALTWEFVSRIAEGGKANTTNGATPIWEPYLLQYKGQLVAYYSDQRDPLHGQKLAHQTSNDLKNWGPVVNDVVYDEYLARPGMTVVDYIPPLQKWILVHELPVGQSSSYGSNYPVYYVMADSPLEFAKNKGRPIVIGNSSVPNACPYVVWSPIGGPNGTIVVSSASRKLYTNTHGGALDKWEAHITTAGAAYSRSIQIFKKRPDHLMIYGAETFSNFGKGLHTPFSATVVGLQDVLKAPATYT
ncbi:hypothetical protein CFE70_003702 [Pyrenophora teres f. teres 0-1]|uniref:Glycoside hydrolase family 93 protein n=2 Tax=Pyrenophora teres f. teres TaxID=97479 RepID=E3RHE4_PYRTT|nr:hypothetical protein PTT_07329 [Pyrenophora teres f. teres 0-1]KAE8845839.1 hypothetical protein HRS9139_00406 [Pyrenophora teres f. teres]KAE8847977.1 hypothetical protein PTNB85_01820 [Pyrenophora teres f. teres]KAE8867903.1 hypothetical protein PTNB29_01814 [Pyrenophora teres f. teres]KAK1907374.1 hypothetical protein P3342_005700 [Pyrenophora teres f. teres]